MSNYQYIGVDLETSGTTHEHHVPIQIGVALVDGRTFKNLIGGWDWDSHLWDDESEKIHGFTQQEVTEADCYEFVDTALERWLKEQVPNGTRIMVGWNVGSFDRPFIQRWLPKTARLIIRRTLDLNAACYLLDQHGFRNPDTLKRQAKAYADQILGGGGRHDALYDAQAAILEME